MIAAVWRGNVPALLERRDERRVARQMGQQSQLIWG